MSTHAHFYCKPACGELIETTLRLEPDKSAAIHGIVLDPADSPVPGASILLFRIDETQNESALIAKACTDAEGHFVFGSLKGDVLYQIRAFRNDTAIRVLE